MTWCKRYRAMADHTTCEADIAYRSVRLVQADKPSFLDDYPCFNPDLHNCPYQDWPTQDDIREEEATINRAITQMLFDIANNICPHCKTPITHKRQVGRCVYADPCGCRLYQGKL